jgi:ADP-ribose pyrophosphatase
MGGLLPEFREFAMRGNVVDLAVGIIIGTSFGRIVSSLVDDVIMPPIGLLLGQVDFSNLFLNLSRQEFASLAAARAAGAPVIAYGSFINTVINFMIVAFAVFFLVRQINRLKRVAGIGAEERAAPAPPADVLLLEEIRDILRERPIPMNEEQPGSVARSDPDACMTPGDVEVLEKRTAYQGYFRLDRYRLRHRLYAGDWGSSMQREIFERGHAVAAVLYDPHRDRMVLIEQFRPGAFVAAGEPHLTGAFSPWLIEIVAGIIDEGETPDDVVQREAVEEAGCPIHELERIGTILTSPGGSSETVMLYLGFVSAPEEAGIFGLDEEHEDIRVILACPDEVWQWMDAGRIVNGPALVGLQWFRIHQDRLRGVRSGGSSAA